MSEVIAVPFTQLRPISSPFRAGLFGNGAARIAPAANANPPQDHYAMGYADGEAAANERHAGEHEAADRIVAAIAQLRAEPAEDLARHLAETVSRLVRDIVGETTITADEIKRRAHGAAALLAESDAASAVRLHPDDAALAGAEVEGLAVIAEPGLARGDIRIECASGTLEDGNALRLAALDDALGLGENIS